MTDFPFTHEEFDALCVAISSGLRRIAYRTQGEYAVEDMRGEACMEALELLESGKHDSISSPEFQNHLLARLYNRLCKFTSKVVRFAVRFEDTGDDDDIDKNHWLDGATASPEDDPFAKLCRIEEMQERERKLKSHYSEAVAYFWLFENFNTNREAIAKHLSLSWGWIWRKAKRAKDWAKRQCSLFNTVEIIDHNYVPPPSKLEQRKPLSRQDRADLCHKQRLMQKKLFLRAYVPIRVVER